jgi:hypothetical protein
VPTQTGTTKGSPFNFALVSLIQGLFHGFE